MLTLTRRAFLGLLAGLALTIEVQVQKLAGRPWPRPPRHGLKVPLQVPMRVGLGHRVYLPIVVKE